MKEQSHKNDMRAAIQGDFERLRERRRGEGEPEISVGRSSDDRAEEPGRPAEEAAGSSPSAELVKELPTQNAALEESAAELAAIGAPSRSADDVPRRRSWLERLRDRH